MMQKVGVDHQPYSVLSAGGGGKTAVPEGGLHATAGHSEDL